MVEVVLYLGPLFRLLLILYIYLVGLIMSDSLYFKHKNSQCLYCARFKACHIISPVRRCFVLDSQFVVPQEVVAFIRYKGAFPDSLFTDTLISKITSFNKSITEYFFDERLRLYDS